MSSTMATDINAADTTAIGTDASSLITQVLADYGLQSLGDWAWNEITSGATSAQMLLNMYQTPQFKQRFPAIFTRQAAGLPPISPADYVSYEDTVAQYEHLYGLPKGVLNNPDTISELIGKDISTQELQTRIDQDGYQKVAEAAAEVRQYYAAQFGASGDAALAAQFLNPDIATPLLEKQATAAQLGGTLSMGGVNVTGSTAMKLAGMGVSGAQAQNTGQQLQQEQDLFNNNVGEVHGLEIGQQGVEAAFGLNAQSTQEVLQRQQEREADFKGGGSARSDQYGVGGAGAARPV